MPAELAIWQIDDDERPVEGLDAQGRAVPSYAASLGLTPASAGLRVAATSLELAVYLLLQLPFLVGALPAMLAGIASGDPQAALAERGDLVLIIVCALVSYVLTTAFVLVQLIVHGRRGVTLGKAIVGTRSVNVKTLEKPGFWRGAVVRALVLWSSFAVPLIGPLVVIALSPMFDAERRGRGWADLAGATWVIDVRRGLNPYDIKRMRIARKTVASDLRDERTVLPSLATDAAGQPTVGLLPTARSRGGVLGAPRVDGATGAPARAEGPPRAPAASGTAASSPPRPPVSPAPLAPPAGEVSAAPAFLNVWSPPDLMADPSAGTPVARPRTITLTLDTGDVIGVDGDGVLLGRAPARSADDPALREVAVTDPSLSISKTHLAVIRRGDELSVVDRWSTNGSGLRRDGAETALSAGQERRLQDGDAITFGDRVVRVEIR